MFIYVKYYYVYIIYEPASQPTNQTASQPTNRCGDGKRGSPPMHATRQGQPMQRWRCATQQADEQQPSPDPPPPHPRTPK